MNLSDSIDTIDNEMSPSSQVISPYSIFSPTSRRNLQDLERSFRDDTQKKLKQIHKFTKNGHKNKANPNITMVPIPGPLTTRVLSQSLDDDEPERDREFIRKGTTSICDQDGKGLILNLQNSMILDEELRILTGDQDDITMNEMNKSPNHYHHRTISRTLECGLENVLKEQNDLLRQLSVDHEMNNNVKDNDNYINRNYYYEDYHDSEQDLEEYID